MSAHEEAVAAPEIESGEHRAATPLELLFDLCFVVAIAQAATSLHHAVAEGHGWQGAFGFSLIFFAIWWSWMGFTWFASAFAREDAPYRLAVLVQMVGVSVLAAGVPRAFEHFDYGLVTLGYVILRTSQVWLWLRVARQRPEFRAVARRYALGVTFCQLGWLALLAFPAAWWPVGFAVMASAELLVPASGERTRRTPWDAHHIAERYGLMTIIVVGESVLATTLAVQAALDAEHGLGEVLAVIVAAPIVFFGMWWLYFARPHHERLASRRDAFVWGYAHLAVYGAAAAVGAGLAVAVEHATGHGHAGATATAYALALPLALYLAALWFVLVRGSRECRGVAAAYALGIAILLGAPALIPSPLVAAGVVAALTAVVVRHESKASAVAQG